jgi:hypothetical protein
VKRVGLRLRELLELTQGIGYKPDSITRSEGPKLMHHLRDKKTKGEAASTVRPQRLMSAASCCLMT